ncbi:OmpA family protein [Campylobacter pinnipediorum]|uniref:Peptidoglycan-associated lipoprotein n=1 Tax=Campylobacter pinnipediorum subsp. caledonicus TaxID=1874362 RepID=A0A1S6U8M9_9BACT|nr:OmpA family protein [Campylobacter pinnipediorum]AQW83227.1 Tol-Pal system peptidoglycan-associated lipoprotein [Campylobacter pinnipediorum subsp. pinnipediorum]AQW86397.1 Tol-Pal system peptidoglycan-associated lipoprotein [Campylobacter pinnipediorum subsp. caledonicus]AQW88049.1 Tol-Pal system peptidoglycan-associated lipoprotein [Campylobacter pinnipediorum subsp. caledonicus]OPA71494.1 peptidoglycan-associated lipoprotein [Campylobacter pinnipediorum subsp. caledonicus]
MKNVLLTGLAVAGLLFAGCSQKTPEVDMSADVVEPSTAEEVVYEMSDTDRLNALISSVQSKVQNIYFDFDKFNISADQQGKVSLNAALFTNTQANNLSIKVEGNCDEWGTDEYNYALGLKRAKSTKDALVKNGVSADRISVVSYGESNPVCASKSKSCDAQNRRVEFKVLP